MERGSRIGFVNPLCSPQVARGVTTYSPEVQRNSRFAIGPSVQCGQYVVPRDVRAWGRAGGARLRCRRSTLVRVHMTGSGDLPAGASGSMKDTSSVDEQMSTALSSASSEEDAQNKRPSWAPSWLPDWVIHMSPLMQFAILLPLYAVHVLYFSKKGWELPFKFLAKDKGPGMGNNLENLNLDSVVGLMVLVVSLIWRKGVLDTWVGDYLDLFGCEDGPLSGKDRQMMRLEPIIPKLVDDEKGPPWEVPRVVKVRLLTTICLLVTAFLLSGYGAVLTEQILCMLSVYGVPLTIPTMRAWKVLISHLMWVYMGIRILGLQLKPFFPPEGKWITLKTKTNWLWWALGGYYVSVLLFNCADVINQLILPQSFFNEETVVSKLVNPENNDLVAMAIGSLGPCVSAPIFEEVVYRGFLLPALACYLPLKLAIPLSSVLFAASHLNATGVLPLTLLGLAWAIIYTKSRNLFVTILLHAMWNSRVFLVFVVNEKEDKQSI